MDLRWPGINALLSDVEEFCETIPLTRQVHQEVHRAAEHFGFRFYDSCNVAFALIEYREVLYSEDMQHGKVIYDRLTQVNPFRLSADMQTVSAARGYCKWLLP
jgi:predicted nucleic acid-binding protein